MLARLVRTGDDTVALFMRLVLGVVFFPHGAQKVLGLFGGHGPAATLKGMSQMMPAAFVVLDMIAEFAGSLGLIVGLFTRVAAFGIGCVMVAAIVLVHAKFGFFMNWMGNQKGEGFEYHLLALGLAIALMIRGGGAASIDRAISRGDDSRSRVMSGA